LVRLACQRRRTLNASRNRQVADGNCQASYLPDEIGAGCCLTPLGKNDKSSLKT
jgi:hypothetical protein